MLRLALLLLLAASPLVASAPTKGPLKTIKLPKGFKPDGVAAGWGNYFYTSSLMGKISRIDVTTGAIKEIVSIGNFAYANNITSSPVTLGIVTGIKVDPATKLLFAAGGRTGFVFVVQLATDGSVDDTVDLPVQCVQLADLTVKVRTLINDVTLRSYKQYGKAVTIAYLTDGGRGAIYKVTGCPSKCMVTGPYTARLLVGSKDPAKPALNGIIAAPLPAGQFIVGDSAKQKLFKVIAAGRKVTSVTEIKITGVYSFPSDGLLSVGKAIFAVSGSKVVELKFSASYTRATFGKVVTDKLIAQPSTIGAAKGTPMYAVNAMYKACPLLRPCPKVAFTLVRVDGFKY